MIGMFWGRDKKYLPQRTQSKKKDRINRTKPNYALGFMNCRLLKLTEFLEKDLALAK
jgi:hypothetical protein